MGGGKIAPPETKCQKTQNWLGPKARAFGTFNIIQFCMFPEKIGTIACIDGNWRHFCRRQVEIVQEFPYYSQNHKIEKILPKFYPNESICGPKLDIDSKNNFCNFCEILTSWRHFVRSYTMTTSDQSVDVSIKRGEMEQSLFSSSSNVCCRGTVLAKIAL